MTNLLKHDCIPGCLLCVPVIMVQSETEFKSMVIAWGRKEMLKMLRAWGFTCHKIKTDNELAHALWLLKNRKGVSP